jgi:hypothetical protein
LKNKELLDILIKKLEKSIGNYAYYSEEGPILDKIEQLLNIIKVMNGEKPFEDWYIEELKEEVE